MNQKQYQAYLKSEHWKSFKESKAKCSTKHCTICADITRIELHHLFYRHEITDVQLSDTRWLCRVCHQTAHDLIKSGTLMFPKPDNHNSCFAITKHAVKKARGFGMRNLFAERANGIAAEHCR